MKIVTSIVLFICSVSSAFAGGQTGLITQINVRTDGLHWVVLSGERGEMPACTKGQYKYWMIKDENATYGKSQFSMLLAAYLSGKPVTIIGTGNCSRWGDGEDIGTLLL
ncbi:hypothetical protein [Shewanella baltica]|uniref:hypothetical protein n=1 Tax=Shewanella TaxID=22 RepID=UPI001DACCE03|nr:hypothetical protein [Gammaproteobacteria bacterium]MBU1479829.1 hypothetical protein [Gammaproteobacteria bacterium]MBU1999519.1 hypothetical protein [Gammaproteobacteria bacterium]MBU2130672.1 hypothetical protein [Gammaproteobacteria bacterium]MBU2186910.1 hypothetical protein [Gammaproteobacteria bacterium]